MPANTIQTIKTYVQLVHRYTPQEAHIGLTTIASKNAPAITRWYSRAKLAELIEAVTDIGPRSNVFMRVTPLRLPPTRGRGREADAMGSSVLFSDYDAYGDIEAGLIKLRSLAKPPTMIVGTGGGLHGYWLLDRFYTDIDALKARNVGIYKLLAAGGDEAADAVYDLARILRVPGSFNIKQGVPRDVTIIEYAPERVYTLADFEAATVEVPAIDVWDSEPLPGDFIETVRERDTKLAKRILTEDGAKKLDAALNGDGKVDRSRNDAYIATRLLGLGFPPATVLSVLMAPDWFSGAKYQQTGRYDYVLATVNAAYRAYSKSPDRYFIKSTFIAEKLSSELHTASNFVYTGERLWRYAGGVFFDNGEDFVKERVVRVLGKRWNSRASDEVVRWLVDQSRVDIERVNNHTGLINVANGMLDIASGTLRPHDPRYLSLAQIPVDFDPRVDTSAVDRFVAQLIPEDAIPVFWEFVGSAFILDHYWPKAFLALVGPPHTGKSKLLDWLLRLYGGRRNVTAISLQTLADNKFAGSALFGKLANVFSDLDEAEAHNTGQIKALTGDDNISGEQKFKGFFMFRNTARLFFSANHYPRVRNPDDAFFERAVIIRCDNQFLPGAKKTDPAIVDKLSTPANLSAALWRSFQGLQRLYANPGFSKSASIQNEQNEYRYQADTVSGFLHESQFDPAYAVTKPELYRLYKVSCETRGRKPVSDDMFYKRVADNLERFGMTQSYDTVGDARVWRYHGRKPANAGDQLLAYTIASRN